MRLAVDNESILVMDGGALAKSDRRDLFEWLRVKCGTRWPNLRPVPDQLQNAVTEALLFIRAYHLEQRKYEKLAMQPAARTASSDLIAICKELDQLDEEKRMEKERNQREEANDMAEVARLVRDDLRPKLLEVLETFEAVKKTLIRHNRTAFWAAYDPLREIQKIEGKGKLYDEEYFKGWIDKAKEIEE